MNGSAILSPKPAGSYLTISRLRVTGGQTLSRPNPQLASNGVRIVVRASVTFPHVVGRARTLDAGAWLSGLQLLFQALAQITRVASPRFRLVNQGSGVFPDFAWFVM